MDALADAGDLDYVLALQEATAVAAAEGYARVTGRPAFLNLHTSAGLGNAIGNLTNAQANRTPLVVTAGQQDYHHIVNDPLLSGDLVGIARTASQRRRTSALRPPGHPGEFAGAPSGANAPQNLMLSIARKRDLSGVAAI